MTGVSTSMINQIESGRSQPSYETAKKIFENLAKLEGESSSHTAGDFCSKDIIKLKPTNTLHDAIKKMHQLSISQIPVFDSTGVVGVVSEDGKIIRYNGYCSTNCRLGYTSKCTSTVDQIFKMCFSYKKIKNHRNYHSVRYSKNDGIV